MKYVDWAECILEAVYDDIRESQYPSPRGTTLESVARRIVPGAVDAYSSWVPGAPESGTLGNGVRDLKRRGLISTDYQNIQITQEGRTALHGSLRRTLWPGIFSDHVEETDLEVLAMLVSKSEERHETFSLLRPIRVTDLAISTDDEAIVRVYESLGRLREAGLVPLPSSMDDAATIYPTYRGIVRSTEAAQTEWQERIQELIPEWETTSVDFKQQLEFKTKAQKGEFVRDVIGLANTKSNGRRFLIIGFSNKTRRFTESVALDIDNDRIENLLKEYAEPMPETRYYRIDWPGGVVGVIEIMRDPAKLPYRVRRDIGPVRRGDVKVRHGSHTEAPTQAELDDLVEESRRARSLGQRS